MKYFFDTEFIEDGHTIELLSFGIVSDDGRELYRELDGADTNKANDFVREHVLPHLSGDPALTVTRRMLREEILAFVADDANPEFWAYYADYDWVALCQLFGRMVDLPKGWPMFCRDLKQFADQYAIRFVRSKTERVTWAADHVTYRLPGFVDHHALWDARWCKLSYLAAIETQESL